MRVGRSVITEFFLMAGNYHEDGRRFLVLQSFLFEKKQNFAEPFPILLQSKTKNKTGN